MNLITDTVECLISTAFFALTTMLASTAAPSVRSALSVLRSGSCRRQVTAALGHSARFCTESQPIAPKHFRMTKDDSHDPFMSHPTYTEVSSVLERG